ncbi:MAG: D-glycerate dehydrogenase [Nitrospirales bacterium]|nr:D-glycerate dehydrogenase [Nitrospirales bacterium]
MSKPKVYMTRRVPQEGMACVQNGADMEWWDGEEALPRSVLLEKVQDIDGLYCLLTDTIDVELLERAPRLRVISTMAVGTDHIDVAACTQRGIPVGHTPGALTETSADLAFALLMAAARRVVEGVDYVKAGHWKSWGPMLCLGQDIHGATLGIVGFGRIGRAVAARARGFGMQVLVSHSKPIPEELVAEYRIQQVNFSTLLQKSDFLSLHVPLTPHTRYLFGATEFRAMKPTAMLINTSRGGVVHSQALYEALRDGTIAYAALDVTDPEPLQMDDPLLTLSNCLVVPHIASASLATRTKIAMMAAENLLSGLAGQQVPYCINPEVYKENIRK